ncbi:uncharacterized protein EDB91DRAFT_1165921 [Suillus paluster]|uniref:uncharacterized protein n=1 Tax=Suillus paluster TaxID=48578 RepID=UPI001B86DDC8|nr:uncharacterized protein EDB91DRAFT_1165921 [Suillus paluster]KAG1726617.1 hypothetical protein EDB91DRAFT_1165921 [Suillus paluster]
MLLAIFFHSLVPPSTTPFSSHPSPTATSSVSSNFLSLPCKILVVTPAPRYSYLLSSHYFPLALAVSGVSRSVHAVLTGPRARRRTDAGVAIREDSLMEIWDGLEQCWEDSESLRRGVGGISTVGGGLPLRSAYQDLRETPSMTRS